MRHDIFRSKKLSNGKYTFKTVKIPAYLNGQPVGELPKPEKSFKFLFSLYPNDIIQIIDKNSDTWRGVFIKQDNSLFLGSETMKEERGFKKEPKYWEYTFELSDEIVPEKFKEKIKEITGKKEATQKPQGITPLKNDLKMIIESLQGEYNFYLINKTRKDLDLLIPKYHGGALKHKEIIINAHVSKFKHGEKPIVTIGLSKIVDIKKIIKDPMGNTVREIKKEPRRTLWGYMNHAF